MRGLPGATGLCRPGACGSGNENNTHGRRSGGLSGEPSACIERYSELSVEASAKSNKENERLVLCYVVRLKSQQSANLPEGSKRRWERWPEAEQDSQGHQGRGAVQGF